MIQHIRVCHFICLFRFFIFAFAVPLLVFTFAMQSVIAEGNLAKRAIRLDAVEIDAVNGFSITSINLETGKFYRLRIVSDGRDEYKFMAPELFENSWIEQISIEDKEVKPYGLRAVEFDDEGTIDVFFLPVRPGTYSFYIEHLKTQGFRGEFIVR